MEFLLEIMTEEMPYSHVKIAHEQLAAAFHHELAEVRIKINQLRVLGTGRRLVVLADLDEKQEDREEIVLGPPKKVALTADNQLGPAALGFARSHQISPEALTFFSTPKGEYLGYKKKERGRPTAELLPEVINRVLASLSFPKMMRWNESLGKFSRPVKNLMVLFDGKPLELSYLDWPVRAFTFGHRLHSPRPLQVRSFREYVETLRQNKVIIEPEERRQIILEQAKTLLRTCEGELYPDDELLQKLVNDVEFPLVIMGSFPEKYLTLPIEIISTVLREGQKLFSVVKGGKQLPFFIGVADQIADPKGLIQKGYERVLRARLEDALFFWEQDLKVSLKERIPQLGRVIFHEKLGTYLDKTERLKKIVAFLSQQIGEKGILKPALMAAELCKTDLLTEMVREFPSLQGKVGGLYCRAQNYPDSVAQAIYEHYQPVSLEDASPKSLIGALLSIADKIDSLVGAIGLGAEISGSSDPLGLRRYAQGICKIILDHRLRLSLSRLLSKTIDLYGQKLALSKKKVVEVCLNFFMQRLRFLYEKEGFRYDLINASLGAGLDDIYLSYLRLKALEELKLSPDFESFVLMVRRVNNILQGQPVRKFNPDLLVEKAEQELHAAFQIIKEHALPLIDQGEFHRAQKMTLKLQGPLNNFFDNVLVMVKNEKLRQNRLALLNDIRAFLFQIADFSQIVLDGERKNQKAKN
ncbi:MAG: glycine--tRNA ligase subunit beta [Candidatus Aminicenantes bacterium]|nr:glycine--tRNA ligase subunit beta [Candidatus Aminicenantes bacterium]